MIASTVLDRPRCHALRGRPAYRSDCERYAQNTAMAPVLRRGDGTPSARKNWAGNPHSNPRRDDRRAAAHPSSPLALRVRTVQGLAVNAPQVKNGFTGRRPKNCGATSLYANCWGSSGSSEHIPARAAGCADVSCDFSDASGTITKSHGPGPYRLTLTSVAEEKLDGEEHPPLGARPHHRPKIKPSAIVDRCRVDRSSRRNRFSSGAAPRGLIPVAIVAAARDVQPSARQGDDDVGHRAARRWEIAEVNKMPKTRGRVRVVKLAAPILAETSRWPNGRGRRRASGRRGGFRAAPAVAGQSGWWTTCSVPGRSSGWMTRLVAPRRQERRGLSLCLRRDRRALALVQADPPGCLSQLLLIRGGPLARPRTSLRRDPPPPPTLRFAHHDTHKGRRFRLSLLSTTGFAAHGRCSHRLPGADGGPERFY